MPMTPDAKRQLATTIRGLRERLLADLHTATESAYQLSVTRPQDTGLDEAARRRRGRLLAWIEEQHKVDPARDRDAFRLEAEKQAAYTLLNRLVLLRLLEAMGLRKLKVLSGGWESTGYREFRDLAPALVRGDDTEGYGFLLQLVFEELATELPGLYGPAGVAALIPLPAATLNHLVAALNDPGLESCWGDELTLGWVYQYWNDPEREALDEKIHGGGKIEPHEIASKTQMFTERYIVDWLLQNSLGPMWLAMCRKQGWTAEVAADGTLDGLEARRVEWRAKREAGAVAPGELMPLHGEAERRWAYYVPQPIPADAVASAPASVREIRLLDVAVGSGHFLVVAFDLLVALYREEASHRGEAWSDRDIVESILENNLHGVDIDPRAVQIAAAALWLKARRCCAAARPGRLNLVASALRLGGLADDDPGLVAFRAAVEAETGIPASLTGRIIRALKGADHLGTLLRVDRAVEETIGRYERVAASLAEPATADMFAAPAARARVVDFEAGAAQRTVLERLEGFLARHTAGDDLGLRLRGEQLAAGVRFVRLVRPGSYDLVVGNPPYQGTSRMRDSGYVERAYPRGKADLYAAFLERGLELARDGGVSALLTMRNWMFIKQYKGLREWLLGGFDLRGLGDFAVGAFDEVPNDVLSVVVSVFHRAGHRDEPSIAQQPTPFDDTSYDRQRTARKRAATVCQLGRYEFDVETLKVVPEWPVVYWWEDQTLQIYQDMPLIGDVAPAYQGLITGDNIRFLRAPWEVIGSSQRIEHNFENPVKPAGWVPYVSGAKGKIWIEPLDLYVKWHFSGIEIQNLENKGKQASRPQNTALYFQSGIAFSMIGASFSARSHRYQSIFGDKGSSVFPQNRNQALCSMNSSRAQTIMQSLNPSISFQSGDVNRLPLFPIPNADDIYATLDHAFTTHESHREPSVEFRTPGPAPWRHAQSWAQRAVDRPAGEPLPPYEPELDPEPPTDHLSFALGVALGRFGPDGAGILDPARDNLDHALPHGILFLDGTLPADDDPRDSLGHPAARPLHAAWASHGPALRASKTDLRTWLRLKYFPDVHRTMYENRPIHWPLSSPRRSFVAWINIHRWTPRTLHFLLADHLQPTLTRLDGEITDLRSARDSAERQAAREAEKRLAPLLKHREELAEFITLVEQCADHGPPPPDARTPARETDTPYAPDLDDGVMINSAALWPLLEPQWKDPKKWWKELASASGKKDYDWAHLAMHYWPTRVDEKCRQDPSLAVAHGCFWTYHPARAWAWELRLQDEIGADFRIEEAPYRDRPDHRAQRRAFLENHPTEALASIAKEAIRRRGRGKKARPLAEFRILEPGLWSRHPGGCWDLEAHIINQQSADFRLLAPDEPEARAAFVGANPGKVEERRGLLASLDLRGGLLDEDDEDMDDES